MTQLLTKIKTMINIGAMILVNISVRFIRGLFINKTKKLAKKLGMPVWKVQALIIGGVLICVGGIWYFKKNISKEAFEKGFNEGIKKGSKIKMEELRAIKSSAWKDGAWSAIDEISKLDPSNEYIQYLDELGIIVKDKFDYYDSFSENYNKTYWGFSGEWD